MEFGKCVWSIDALCDWEQWSLEDGIAARPRVFRRNSPGSRCTLLDSWGAGHCFHFGCFGTTYRSYDVQRSTQANSRQTSVLCRTTFADGSGGQLACGLNGLPIAAGGYRTCAIRDDGQLVRFGDKGEGQCNVPKDLGQVLAIAEGGGHTCAVRSDGQLVCFGRNGEGQCNVPKDLGPVVMIAAGGCHTCAVRTDGRFVCFGANDEGRCNVPKDLGQASAIAAGAGHTCAVRPDGQLVCFGRNDHGQCNVPKDLGPVVAIAAGWAHTCAIRADGQLVCFGNRVACNVPTDLRLQTM